MKRLIFTLVTMLSFAAMAKVGDIKLTRAVVTEARMPSQMIDTSSVTVISMYAMEKVTKELEIDSRDSDSDFPYYKTLETTPVVRVMVKYNEPGVYRNAEGDDGERRLAFDLGKEMFSESELAAIHRRPKGMKMEDVLNMVKVRLSEKAVTRQSVDYENSRFCDTDAYLCEDDIVYKTVPGVDVILTVTR